MSSKELFLYEPLQYNTKEPVHLRNLPFRNFRTPTASIRIGQKRSGKGVSIDKEVFKFWSKYFTCIWLHSAGGFENLYTIVNKNCKEKFEVIKSILELLVPENKKSRSFINENIPRSPKEIEMFLGLMKNSGFIYYDDSVVEIKNTGYEMLNNRYLHCQCHGTVDTLWIHPSYLKVNKFTLDWFNGYYFRDYYDYNDAWQKGLVNEYMPESFGYDFKKYPIKKPKSMLERIKPILKEKSFTPPTSPSKVEIFRDEIREAVLLGRDEHRLITNTASSFPETHQGKVEKYSTTAEFINFIPELVQRDFQRLKLDKPVSDWSDKEKNHWKIALFLGEVREIAPAQTLSGDQESGISKRALYNFMPKSRHNQCWVFMDLQSASDMFRGVRQQNDVFMVKRSTYNILGDEFGWFYKLIEDQRKNIIESKDFTIKSIPLEMLTEINSFLPSVDEIPDNKAYVIYPNNEYRLIRINMQRWHHKTESDNLTSDTGIEYTIDKSNEDPNIKEIGRRTLKPEKKLSKKITYDDWILMDSMKQKGKKWPEIIDEMRKKDKQNGIEVDRFAASDPIKNISNKYNSWKNAQGGT